MKVKKYLNTKNLSKILVFGILLNSIPINSFASILSGDGRYEAFEDSNITINDILEEDEVDVEIEGNTLVNNCLNSTKDGVVINKVNRFDSSMIKPNTEYTLIFDIPENNLKENNKFVIEMHSTMTSSKTQIYPGETGRFIRKVRTYDVVNLIPWIAFDTGNISGDGSNVVLKNLMVLEGDWTNRDVPEYFEGMKSVGQDDVNGHKTEVLYENKNLLKINVDSFEHNGVRATRNGDKLILDGTCTEKFTIRLNPTKFNWEDNGFDLEEGSTYTLSSNYIKGRFNVMQYKTWNLAMSKPKTTTFTTDKIPSNAYSNLFAYIIVDEGLEFNNEEYWFMLEKSSEFTSYEPYIIDKKEILLNEPLRGLPSGVKDRIIKKNGQWVIERNCREIILNGDENWSYQVDKINDENPMFDIRLNALDIVQVNAISDKFRGYTAGYTWYNDEESISLNHNGHLQIRINRSKLKSVDIEGFKEWVRDNEVTVIYKLATPIYESLNANLNIPLYLDTTYISTKSTIPANLKVTVDRVANRAKEYSKLAKENPTIENISLARMWTNLMRESILKDEFQNDVDSITEVTDITLERQTDSANVDVYIKSENMLSMSLNTNSITFDDFSGLEDEVKENVINISINSSLPYNLNAYLATEIQNRDKSKIMDLDILSIKEHSETAYKKFANINEKLVLKDNNPAGNDLVHGIDLKLNSGIAHEKDIYKTTIKFEAKQT